MVRIHRRTVQKNLNDMDNHDDVVTYLELDILECEVKWALGSITTNKATGSDRIPVELSQMIKRKILEISSIKLEIPREYFMQRWA